MHNIVHRMHNKFIKSRCPEMEYVLYFVKHNGRRTTTDEDQLQ